MRHRRIRIHHVGFALATVVAVGSITAASNVVPTPTGGAACHSVNELPDLSCTPGVADPRVTQANVQQTICVKGYTATVRPPVSVTGPEKLQSQKDYGYASNVKGEYDHLIPLELGGSSDTKNLWFEAGTIPNAKDKVENHLRSEVCAGSTTLAQAQSEIVKDWQTAQ